MLEKSAFILLVKIYCKALQEIRSSKKAIINFSKSKNPKNKWRINSKDEKKATRPVWGLRLDARDNKHQRLVWKLLSLLKSQRISGIRTINLKTNCQIQNIYNVSDLVRWVQSWPTDCSSCPAPAAIGRSLRHWEPYLTLHVLHGAQMWHLWIHRWSQ